MHIPTRMQYQISIYQIIRKLIKTAKYIELKCSMFYFFGILFKLLSKLVIF